MQKDNSNIIGFVAFACLLASATCSYFGETVSNGTYQLFDYISLLFGACFTFAMAKCISILEHHESDKS